mgnify:CR=1 FL=1
MKGEHDVPDHKWRSGCRLCTHIRSEETLFPDADAGAGAVRDRPRYHRIPGARAAADAVDLVTEVGR